MKAKKLSHKPFNAIRPGHDGERIFAEAWQRIADKSYERWDGSDRTIFEDMFTHYRWEAGQREATVAASLICWLGTNCGRAFVLEAKRVSKTLSPSFPMETALIMQWAVENTRRVGINRQLRVIEYLLTPHQDMDDAGRDSRFIDWSLIAKPTAKDHEAVECVVAWLGSDKGQEFLKECETEMKLARTNDSLRRLEEAGHGDSKQAQNLREMLAAGA